MRARPLSMLVLAAVVMASAPPPAGHAKGRKDIRLRQFTSCSSLIAYGLRHAPPPARVPVAPAPQPELGGGGVGGGQDGATGRPAPAAAPVAGQDFSTTNTQVAGVDEPDIVKTDGSTVFAIARGALQAIDVRGAEPKLLGSLKLAGYGQQLLLQGDRALVMTTATPAFIAQTGAPMIAPVPEIHRPTTVLSEIAVKNPAAMRVIRTMEVDGSLVAARMTGSTARVVLATTPRALIPEAVAPPGPVVATAARVNRRRARAWLPSAVFVNKRAHTRKRRAITSCRATRHPRRFSGLGMLTVLTIDLSKGLEPVDSDSVMSGGETVYASHDALYVATQRYVRALWDQTAERVPDGMTTEIHKFDISQPDETRYRGSGQVPGFLLNQFAMDEHEGVLRTASTEEPSWFADRPRDPSQSYVTTLAERDRALVRRGQVAGLGKGERIYAVRFIGDLGYVVTFRQTDPLYTIGLADPAAPKVLGELKIRGYSAYLHPAGEGLLIGIGQDATDQGRTLGTQISLFDVSDPANPARLQQAAVGSGSSSEAEYDHHAFLWWPATGLAVLPVTVYPDAPVSSEPETWDPFLGAIGFTVGRTGIAEAGRITHPGSWEGAVRRSIVIGDRLLTLSETGLKLSRLDTLADVAWLPFSRG